jgi:hypothetical protein
MNITLGASATTVVKASTPSVAKSETSSKKEQLPVTKLDIETGEIKKEAPKVDIERLVMKPSPIPLEQRMDMVISKDEVKDLLSMMVHMPVPKRDNTAHKVDLQT